MNECLDTVRPGRWSRVSARTAELSWQVCSIMQAFGAEAIAALHQSRRSQGLCHPPRHVFPLLSRITGLVGNQRCRTTELSQRIQQDVHPLIITTANLCCGLQQRSPVQLAGAARILFSPAMVSRADPGESLRIWSDYGLSIECSARGIGHQRSSPRVPLDGLPAQLLH